MHPDFLQPANVLSHVFIIAFIVNILSAVVSYYILYKRGHSN